jgi:hypothetical protein
MRKLYSEHFFPADMIWGGGALSCKYSNPSIHVLLLYESLLYQVCKLIWGAHTHKVITMDTTFYGGA